MALIVTQSYEPVRGADGGTALVSNETLANHLATNAAGRARGLPRSYANLSEVENWRTGVVFSETNLALLTNAVWSKDFWLKGALGLSATSIGYSNGFGGQGVVTMVSPRHYLFSTHMHPEGYLAAFLGSNNVIHWRRTLQRVDVGIDTSVGILDADLPASVGFVPVLPPDFTNYLDASGATMVQGVGMNQDLCVFSQPMRFWNAPGVGWDSRAEVPFGVGTNWSLALRGGDSSSPAFLLVRNQLVLVAHVSSIGGGPNYAFQISEINRQMHYLSTNNRARTDYQLTLYPLNEWPRVDGR